MAANTKSSWFDEATSELLIADHAQRLDSFLKAVADGEITDDELTSQEARVVKLMKEIEPQLDPKLHERVTQLLCEITAFDIMQAMNMMQSARPRAKFVG